MNKFMIFTPKNQFLIIFSFFLSQGNFVYSCSEHDFFPLFRLAFYNQGKIAAVPFRLKLETYLKNENFKKFDRIFIIEELPSDHPQVLFLGNGFSHLIPEHGEKPFLSDLKFALKPFLDLKAPPVSNSLFKFETFLPHVHSYSGQNTSEWNNFVENIGQFKPDEKNLVPKLYGVTSTSPLFLKFRVLPPVTGLTFFMDKNNPGVFSTRLDHYLVALALFINTEGEVVDFTQIEGNFSESAIFDEPFKSLPPIILGFFFNYDPHPFPAKCLEVLSRYNFEQLRFLQDQATHQ